jgi:hypothetical protein
MTDFNQSKYILTLSGLLSFLLYGYSERTSSCAFTEIVSIIFVTAVSWPTSVAALSKY